MRRGDSDESLGLEMNSGRIVRVRNDHDASGIQRRIDLLERRNLRVGRIEPTAGEGLQIVGVSGHRHLHGGVVELTAHRPDELAGATTGDHRTVGYAGRFAIQLDQLGRRLVRM
jgi:hypothetical protein